MAQENRSWGYDRLVGALANLGYTISDQTVGNILKRYGLPPAPERKTTTTWKEFIRTHMDVLVATDFFTAEVWTLGGLVTYYVLFFIHLGSRKVEIAGMTPHPHAAWMVQMARHVTMEAWGCLSPGQYLIHDRDGKYCPAFQQLIDAAGITRVPLPPRSPNLNAYAERWVRSVKEECLSRLILFGEASLWHALQEYVAHYHHERNHQGKGNVLLLPPSRADARRTGPIRCRERLGVLCLSAGKYRFNLHLMEYGMRVALPRSIYDLSGLRPSQEYAAATFDNGLAGIRARARLDVDAH